MKTILCYNFFKKGSETMFNIFKKSNPNINNSAYGGFVISKNVTKNGKKIRYSYRRPSNIPELNGWTIYSVDDDDAYVNDPSNFEIVNATTIYKIDPTMLKIFDAPYGTDLCWMY